jgi:intracellular septation protein A
LDRSFAVGEAVAAEAPWMLVAGAHPKTGDGAGLSKRRVLVAVARRGVPNLIEATVFPAVLFFVVVTTIGPAVAMAAVLVWSYGAILRRVLRAERIPAILMLATLGLTIRTLVGLLSGSVFAYFVQPVATTVVLAGVFLGSVVIGRPVIARLAHDFCPISYEVAKRPEIVRLFVGLTILWAGVHLLTAATTLGMLVSMSVPMFVAFKTVACLGITIAAIVITVTWALRTASRAHLVFATT